MANILYDGVISGGAILAALTISGQNVVAIPYANGMRVLLMQGLV